MGVSIKSPLDDRTQPGSLVIPLEDKRLICTACGHRCDLKPGQRGVCKVRYNEEGTLRVPAQYVSGLHNDPIEKKPFFHAYPGTAALSFGMLGCDFRCGYCQNWFTSQTLRDEKATTRTQKISAGELCHLALEQGARSIVSTYNEPLITSEWAVEVFQEAKRNGLITGYVSNGNATPEVLDFIQPWVDLYKIDLKCFDEKNYRRLGGPLQGVLDTIASVYERGFWLEVVTLVIPGYNDSDAELAQMAEFLAGVSRDIPWHVTAFHPDYRMTDRDRTPASTLLRAREHGQSAGLRYIYSGNLPGRVGETESTWCPACRALLIERVGFRVLNDRLCSGACPDCGERIPGRWLE